MVFFYFRFSWYYFFLLINFIEALTTPGVMRVALSGPLTVIKIEHIGVVGLVISFQTLALLQLQVTVTSDPVHWVGGWIGHLDCLDLPYFLAIGNDGFVAAEIAAFA